MFSSKSQFPFWLRLALHALWLHGAWEAVQCRLFYDMSGAPVASAFFFMIAATGEDVVLTLALVAIAVRFRQRRPIAITPRVFVALAGCGTSAAILIEILALSLGWWRYSPTMPALRLFGRAIGLLPVVQMALLPSAALVLARFSLASKSNSTGTGLCSTCLPLYPLSVYGQAEGQEDNYANH